MLAGSLRTVFGWPVAIGDKPNPRSLRNFPCQANGAEMLRLAACFATEQGIEVCAVIHDAVLICAPLDRLDQDIERMQAAMAKASRIVLDGFELRTEVNVIPRPLPGPARRRDVGPGAATDRTARSNQTGGSMMLNQEPFELEQLRIDPERVTKPVKPKKWRRHFVRVPWVWVERLQTARRVSTYRLALLLVYEHWRTGARPVVLSNVFTHAEGLSRRSKWRAIAELERLGLIQVKRHQRRAPMVVLQYLNPEQL
jgi:hypothetical protein